MSKSSIPASPSAKTYDAEAERDLSWIEARDPIALFEDWAVQARATEINDSHAMALATVDEAGMPDVRMVLLKGLDERGFVFYTNAESTKGEQLIGQGKAALCFHWKSQRRQVRIRGEVERVTEAESDAYFASRARGSQIGAWASQQSRPVDSRDTLKAATKEIEAKYEGRAVPRPPRWYGWRVKPETIEFWQNGAYRLHDRIVFSRTAKGWETSRLFP